MVLLPSAFVQSAFFLCLQTTMKHKAVNKMGGGGSSVKKKKKLKAFQHCRVPLSEVLHPDVLGGGTSSSLHQGVSTLLKNLRELTETSK